MTYEARGRVEIPRGAARHRHVRDAPNAAHERLRRPAHRGGARDDLDRPEARAQTLRRWDARDSRQAANRRQGRCRVCDGGGDVNRRVGAGREVEAQCILGGPRVRARREHARVHSGEPHAQERQAEQDQHRGARDGDRQGTAHHPVGEAVPTSSLVGARSPLRRALPAGRRERVHVGRAERRAPARPSARRGRRAARRSTRRGPSTAETRAGTRAATRTRPRR